jgi:exodeoxyribonuclease V beta subunit
MENASIGEIDLDRHGIAEASAGTGKTHLAERLVLRLLTQKRARLDEILLMTYTEKATGELHGRLRQALETAIDEQLAEPTLLQAALDSFDNASICTIHSFCQRSLREFAFDHRCDFGTELVNDPELLEVCLRETQRKSWRQEYGPQLRTVLELAGYHVGDQKGASWEQLVLKVASRYRPACGHVLLPRPLGDWPENLRHLEPLIRDGLFQLRELAALAGPCRPEEHAWHIGFGKLDFRTDWREARRRDVLRPLLLWLTAPDAQQAPLSAFRRLLLTCRRQVSFREHGFRILTDRLSAAARAQLSQLCPKLPRAVDILDPLRRVVDWNALGCQLAARTISQLHACLAGYKQERGLHSYEDMLVWMDEALDPARNPCADNFLHRLRGRYRYGIIDEFQDTDGIQWRIFRRIFVDGTSEHRLWVVGDPKQAVFGFRGADLGTYVTATRELREQHGAQALVLDVNRRMCPELIAPLNQLFDQGQWFAGTGITFHPVRPPAGEEQPNRIVSDRTGRPALTLIDVSDIEKLSAARRKFACFIADEIGQLLEGPSMEVVVKGGAPRPLLAGDVCILVRTRNEAAPVLAALRSARIPFSFYKQPGLWESDEAMHLRYVLRAVARPADRQAFQTALLTHFCRVRPEELARSRDLPPDHELRRLFRRWTALANTRNWAALFQSLLEDTGLVYFDPDAPHTERRLANYRHLLQTLARAAYDQDLDLLGVLDFLNNRRRQAGNDDSDLQPIETERSKVCIMTIHAGKGLEFPVVFVAGGFTRSRDSEFVTYRDGETLVFDLSPEEAGTAASRAEKDGEDRRLMYVALTRPMFKLYLPLVPTGGRAAAHAGPLGTVLAPAIAQADLLPAAVPPMPSQESVSARDGLPRAAVPLPPAPPHGSPIQLPGVLFPALDPHLPRRRIVLRSFSSLHRSLSAVEGLRYGDRLPGGDDSADGVAEPDPLRGRDFGNLVHDVLQHIDYAAVGQAASPRDLWLAGTSTRNVLDEQLSRHLPGMVPRANSPEVRDACRQQVARLVWLGLHTPLAAIGGPLWQLPCEDRLHELEFLFPELDAGPAAGHRHEEGFFTGFMDLVFRRCGRFFLLDWKTNTLAAYSPEAIAQSMVECHYRLQYRLYLQALTRCLARSLGVRFDFSRDFGGVYYLYLRGLNGRDESSGVFFHRPTAGDLPLDRLLLERGTAR